MSSFAHPSVRTNLQKLYRRIDRRFTTLNSFFELKPESSTDTENNKWKDEWEECKRLSIRFERWASTYRPWTANQKYDTKRMMGKKRELLTLYNQLYDATTNLCVGIKYPTWSSDSWWTVPRLIGMSWKDDFGDSSDEDEPNWPSDNDSDSSSDDDGKKQSRPFVAAPKEERTEADIKKQYVQLLLKIAHQVYECERFQFGLEDFGPGLYTAHMNDRREMDHEEKDPDRAVYKVLCEGEDDKKIINNLFNTIRSKHVAAPPMLYWKRHLTKLVPDWQPVSSDGPS